MARLRLDVNRGSLPPVAEIPIGKNTLSRRQAGREYGIMSTQYYKRGYISPISHLAEREVTTRDANYVKA